MNPGATEQDACAASSAAPPSRFVIRLALLLVLGAVALAHWPMLDNALTNWDDEGYVLHNPYIRQIDGPTLRAFFTDPYKGNYHPLTQLSLALDYARGGDLAAPYLQTNLALHLTCTLLVFACAARLLRDPLVGVLAAALFGLHPLHVESVAWISERKDVLYAVFYFLALLLYTRALDHAAGRRLSYGLALLAFLASLLSKGQAVALAPSLYLVDVLRGRDLRRAYVHLEKLPFLALALAFGLWALEAQRGVGQLLGTPSWSLGERILLASQAYLLYLAKLVLPIGLSAFHPYPERDALGVLHWLSPLGVIATCALFVRSLRRHRVVAFAIGFFTLNILLLLQIIPVGGAHIAERYVYVASFGPALLVGALLSKPLQRLWSGGDRDVVVWSSAALLLLMALGAGALTWRRVDVWQDSITLWSDVIDKKGPVAIAHLNRGLARHAIGDLEGAERDLSAAIEADPGYARARAHRGVIRSALGRNAEALADLDRAIALSPDADAHINRGAVRLAAGDAKGAVADFRRATALRPGDPLAHNNLGHARLQAGHPAAALPEFARALSLAPGYVAAHHGSGLALLALGDGTRALIHFERALELHADHAAAHLGRAEALALLGRTREACDALGRARALDPTTSSPTLEKRCDPR